MQTVDDLSASTANLLSKDQPDDLTVVFSSTANLLQKEKSTDSKVNESSSCHRIKLILFVLFCLLIIIAFVSALIFIIPRLKSQPSNFPHSQNSISSNLISSSNFSEYHNVTSLPNSMNISTSEIPKSTLHSTITDSPETLNISMSTKDIRTSNSPPGSSTSSGIPLSGNPSNFNNSNSTVVTESCQTAECFQIAEAMKGFMNLEADPCDDFYKYSCGGYNKDQSRPGRYGSSTFDDIGQKNSLKIKELLEQSEELDGTLRNSTAIQKARRYYKACLRDDFYDDDYLWRLTGLVGGWPLSSGNVHQRNIWNFNDWNFQEALSKSLEFSDPLLDARLKRNERNISEYVIYVDQSGLLLPSKHYIASEASHNYNRETYVQHFKATCHQLGARTDLLDEVAENVWQFEKSLGAAFEPPEKMTDPSKLYNPMTVEELQKLLNVNNSRHTINIQLLLSRQMGRSVSPTETVVVRVPDYFRKMALLVGNTDKDTLSSYLVWSMLRSLAPHAGEPFLENHNRFIKKLNDETEDIDKWETCVVRTIDAMEFAVGALYVNKYLNETDRKNVGYVLDSLMKVLSDALPEISWMSEASKKAAQDKIDKVEPQIGYPDFILIQKELDLYYKDYNVTDSPLQNQINHDRFENKVNNAKYGTVPGGNEWGENDITPTDVNAYNIITANQIFIPAGILQPPFYSRHTPISVLFGSLGFLTGHELIHGFDSTGAQYGPNGELKEWLDETSRKEFDIRSNCIVNEYSNFSVNGLNLNGEKTLDENIADNGGLKIAHAAFIRATQSNQKVAQMSDSLLPYLNLSPGQQFFVSFAQLFCAAYTEEEEEEEIFWDPHSISRYRVLGVVRNLPDFSEAFSCSKDAPMNPQKRCEIW